MKYALSPRSSTNDISHQYSYTHILGTPKSPVRFLQRIIPTIENVEFSEYSKINSEFADLNNVKTHYFKNFSLISFNLGETKMQRPHYSGNTLAEILQSNGPLSEELMLNTARRIIREIEVLHQNDLCVKNLKAENVIMHHNGIRVVDYGYDFMFQDTLKSNKVNQLLYAGPEGLDGKIAPSKELDIYHFGLLIYLMNVGRFPWIIFNQAKIINEMKINKIYIPETCDYILTQIIRKCLDPDPSQRPNARQIHLTLLKFIQYKNLLPKAETEIVIPKPNIMKPQPVPSVMSLDIFERKTSYDMPIPIKKVNTILTSRKLPAIPIRTHVLSFSHITA